MSEAIAPGNDAPLSQSTISDSQFLADLLALKRDERSEPECDDVDEPVTGGEEAREGVEVLDQTDIDWILHEALEEFSWDRCPPDSLPPPRNHSADKLEQLQREGKRLDMAALAR